MAMCFGSLLDGDATEKPIVQLLAGEFGAATKNGAVAALIVALVLGWAGGGVVPVALRAAGAFALGVALHQTVLLAGIAVLRTRERAFAPPTA